MLHANVPEHRHKVTMVLVRAKPLDKSRLDRLGINQEEDGASAESRGQCVKGNDGCHELNHGNLRVADLPIDRVLSHHDLGAVPHLLSPDSPLSCRKVIHPILGNSSASQAPGLGSGNDPTVKQIASGGARSRVPNKLRVQD